MFNLQNSLSYEILNRRQRHDGAWGKAGRLVLLILTLGSVGYWLIFVLSLVLYKPLIAGIALLIMAAAIWIIMSELYYHEHVEKIVPSVALKELVKNDDWMHTVNLAEYFSPGLARALSKAQKNGSYSLEDLVGAMMRERDVQVILSRAGFTSNIKPSNTGTPAVSYPVDSIDPLMVYAAAEAVASGTRHIHLSHVIKAMLEHYQPFANLMFSYNIEQSELIGAIGWFQNLQILGHRQFFWEKGKVGVWGIGRDWASGYTPTLSQYAIDLGQFISEKSLQIQIVGRQEIISQLELALSSGRRSNVLLVGQPGVGKKVIVNGLAAKVASGNVARELANKHMMQLDVSRIISSAGAQAADKLYQALKDAVWAGNIILFIDNIQTILNKDENALGSVDAGEILTPFLRSGKLQIIGSTTPDAYHTTISTNAALGASFTRVNIDPASPEDSVLILEEVVLHLEYRHGVFFSYPILKEIVDLARRYIHQYPLPESAINVAEAAAIAASARNAKVVSQEDVDGVISKMSRVPVGDVAKVERDRLLNLEDVLHKRVVGQDEAIAAVANAMRRARSGLASGKRPIGSFLFLGPTGVGKTETARALAEAYFNDEKNMIRIDMSEFQTPDSLARLIGTPTRAQEASAGQLMKAVRDQPFSLILLDEVEKAHPDVLNIFLQILEDGIASDGRGEQVDFTNSIIVATSNAGSDFIRQKVRDGQDSAEFKEELLDYLQSKGMFRPEFLNRFDAIVAYKPLTKEQLMQIIDFQLISLNKRLSERDIKLELTEAAKVKLADLGYQPEFGARPLRRVIQDRIENKLADKLLKGETERGQVIRIDEGDL